MKYELILLPAIFFQIKEVCKLDLDIQILETRLQNVLFFLNEDNFT